MSQNLFHRTSIISPNMYEGARLVTPRPGSYERLANKLIEEMDKRSFDPHAFAYLLSSYPETVQDVLFQFAISLLNAWAAKRECRSEEEAIRRNEAKFVIMKILQAQGNP